MAITILHAPEELATVGNPIAYRVATDNAAVKYIMLRLSVESAYGSLEFQKVIEKESPPDEDRESVFYIDKNLEPCLAPEAPDFTSSEMTKAKQLCKRYKVAFAELTENDRPEDALFVEQPVRFAILAKIPFDKFALSKILTSSNILTTKETARRLFITQLEYITIIAPSNAYSIDAIFVIHYQDSTLQVINKSFGELQKSEIGFIPVGISHRSYPNPTQIDRIEVTVAGTTLIYTVFEPSDLYTPIEFYYLAQNAALESLVCDGDSDTILDIDRIDSEHFVPYDYDPKFQKFRQSQVTERTAGVADTGYMPPSEHRAAAQIFISRLISMRKNQEITPVVVSKKQIALDKTSERMKSHKIEYMSAS